MKKRNGIYYRKVKTCMGRVFWVEMSMEEVIAHDLGVAQFILAPFAMVWLFAWAAGML